jgi:hypothetical protein
MSETQNAQSELGSEQQILDSAFHNIAKRGALSIFSELRDEAVEAANKLQRTFEQYSSENILSEPERAEVKRLGNEFRNRIIVLQNAVDKSFEFENISSSEGRRVN